MNMNKRFTRAAAVLGVATVGLTAAVAMATQVTAAVPMVPADCGRFSGSPVPAGFTLVDMATTANPNFYVSPGGLGREFVIGTSVADIIVTSGDADVICALAGADFVDASGGSDKVFGGIGEDVLEGGSDRDILHGMADHDELFGEGDNDVLYGGDDADDLDGGTGGNDNDTGDGGAFADTCVEVENPTSC